jgi:hypothetical protein
LSAWVLEMRIRVKVELEQLDARKSELKARVADLDSRPSFITAEDWLVAELDRPAGPEPTFTRSTSDWLPQQAHHLKRRGHGPHT